METLPTAVAAALADILGGGRIADDVESEVLEFKRETASPKETLQLIADAAICLANASGGHIVVGVADRTTGAAALLGATLTESQVRRGVRDRTRPALEVDVVEFHHRGVRLLLVAVPEEPEFVSDPKGRATRRSGSDCEPLTPGQIARLREGRKAHDWSDLPLEPVGKVDERAIEIARAKLSASLRPTTRALAALSEADLLRALGVSDESGRIRRAAILLQRRRGEFLYQYKETPGGEPRVIERLDGPLLVAYERILELISARTMSTPLTLPTGQQIHIQDFPELAVREAISNAMMHRDHRRREPIVVEHSPNALVVISPGGLVAGVTPQNILTHTSAPRNPTLAAACRTLELAEEIGRGVDRMCREMVRSGRRLPQIDDDGDHVRVVLTGGAPDLNVARFVAQQSEAFRDDTDAMLTLLTLCGRRTVTAEDLAATLQKGVEETETSLRLLATEQFALVEPTHESARRRYPPYRLRPDVVRALGTAVPYARHTSDDIEQRVTAHLAEYGRITNATVRNLFNVTVQRANQILSELRDREVIVRTSTASRGPSVEYGPGAKFAPPSAARPRRRRSVSS